MCLCRWIFSCILNKITWRQGIVTKRSNNFVKHFPVLFLSYNISLIPYNSPEDKPIWKYIHLPQTERPCNTFYTKSLIIFRSPISFEGNNFLKNCYFGGWLFWLSEKRGYILGKHLPVIFRQYFCSCDSVILFL